MSYKLLCFDMDGVLFKDINFWLELHKSFGTLQEGLKLTEKYLHTDYDRLVEEVVGKLWKGRDAKPYYALVNSIEYVLGVDKVFGYAKKKDLVTAIISASSIDVARRVQRDYGVDHLFANELVIKQGKVSGEFIWPVGAGKHKKADIVKHLQQDLGISVKECIYIGDSETDIEAFEQVGLSIAFNPPSDKVRKAATWAVESNTLQAVLKYLPK
ncbi:TPA: HAD-IB family phosphatase [Candidatus Woesearchaeota archaeon]|nr:HAD family phosphatase [Candidatus Woesearchaeota archaeon]HIG92810.1 HAD-IB family phosphatase [Candidatus Woesearchaeota archaeon]HIH13396.1 HAD-IB family phosphatase [Candidatus Woesearchaeota archaeon]